MTTKKWILLVEDNPNDADLVMRALHASQPSTSVVHAMDGSAALDCLRRRGPFQSLHDGPPTMILLDLKMPKVDGLEVLEEIKADARLKTIPVVIFTSSREERQRLRGQAGGVSQVRGHPAGAALVLDVDQ
jgi:CheY-like chemotaxis protein